jgi:hypothetical protein
MYSVLTPVPQPASNTRTEEVAGAVPVQKLWTVGQYQRQL